MLCHLPEIEEHFEDKTATEICSIESNKFVESRFECLEGNSSNNKCSKTLPPNLSPKLIFEQFMEQEKAKEESTNRNSLAVPARTFDYSSDDGSARLIELRTFNCWIVLQWGLEYQTCLEFER